MPFFNRSLVISLVKVNKFENLQYLWSHNFTLYCSEILNVYINSCLYNAANLDTVQAHEEQKKCRGQSFLLLWSSSQMSYSEKEDQQ